MAGPKNQTIRVLNYSLIVARYHIFTTSVRNATLDIECFLDLNIIIRLSSVTPLIMYTVDTFTKSCAKLLSFSVS